MNALETDQTAPTTRLAWATDLHLEFAKERAFERFCEEVLVEAPDGLLLGGDTAVAPSLEAELERLASRLELPIWFVLGNHDFYHGSIAEVRELAERITRRGGRARWLPSCGVVEAAPGTALVGVDGWADGRLGNGPRSHMVLNDHHLIEELAGLEKRERFELLARLGDAEAERARGLLEEALAGGWPEIVLLTHVPPFAEAAWHLGRRSDDEALPHFASKAVGEVLRELMAEAPDRRLSVLCGHTHSGGEARILENLRVRTGPARYGSPSLQEILTVR